MEVALCMGVPLNCATATLLEVILYIEVLMCMELLYVELVMYVVTKALLEWLLYMKGRTCKF
jgi:hypothetical protein